MTPGRLRLIAATVVLMLSFTAGIVWLVRLSASSASRPPATPPQADAAAASPLAEDSSVAPDPAGAPQPSLATPPVPQPSVRQSPPKPTVRTPSASGGALPSSPRGDTAPPVPTQTIRVAGATLDSAFPDNRCWAFWNDRYGIAVTISAITLRKDESDSGLYLEASRCRRLIDDLLRYIKKPAVNGLCQVGTTLKVGGEGCYTGVSVRDGETGGTGTIVLDLKARCTTAAVPPCSAEEVARLSPSPTRPVDVTWTNECGTGATDKCANVDLYKEEPSASASSTPATETPP